MAIVINQEHFRVRTDATAAQGGTPVWAAAQDTNCSIPITNNFRIRFAISDTGTTTDNPLYAYIFYSQNGGAYTEVLTTSSFVQDTDVTGGASSNGSAITTQLLTGVGTFLGTGQYISGDSGSASSISLTHGDCVEYEFGLKFVSGVTVGDTYAFQFWPGGVAANTYTHIPTITVAASGVSPSPNLYACYI